MIKVKLIQDTRIGGVKVLSGAVLEFAHSGQARSYTNRKIAELVEPKKKSRAKPSKGDTVDDSMHGGTSTTTANTRAGKDESSSKPD